MKNKTDVTVIVPVHTTDIKNFNKLIKKAYDSVLSNTVLPERLMFVIGNSKELWEVESKDVIAKIKKIVGTTDELVVDYTINKGCTDFASQMNYGALNVETKYMSLLELDDEYAPKWFENVEKYAAEFPDIAMFLPIISDTDEDNHFLGYTNEIAWAYEFTEKQGILDGEVLKEYPNFNPDGMVMLTDTFLDMGGYKKNIKLTFNLEFLLRACDQSAQIMVIPKIGYNHINMREHSLFWEYKNGENQLNSEEAALWLEVAKKEFYYIDDREVELTPPVMESKTVEPIEINADDKAEVC